MSTGQVRVTSGCLVVLIALVCLPDRAVSSEFHVSPTGTAKGAGSLEAPWDLATAFSAPDSVKPGDTIWLHAGTYRGGFASKLTGRPDAPIVVRGETRGRVTIDASPRDEKYNALFSLGGADTIYRDFEVTSSLTQRETKIRGPWPDDIKSGNVDVRGDRISLVNLVVHDLSSGFGFWAQGEGGEISGCLIYNNGWRGPDRGHGHAIYAQNIKGTKRIVDNILFHQFGYGIHVYGSTKAALKGFEIDGNIAFENGVLAGNADRSAGIMVGGESPAARIAIRDNVVVGGNIRVGYPWGVANDDLLLTGNYCDGGLVVRDFREATVSKNTLVAHSNVVQIESAEKMLLPGLKWNDNDYYVTDGRWGETAIVENNKSRGLSYVEWKQQTGLDAKSTFTRGTPMKLRVTVRPNAHEKGRANIAIVNPAALPEVEVDLSKVLTKDQPYRVLSAKDIFGSPVLTGVYDGQAVRVPMKPVAPPPPVGLPNAKLPVTEPLFAAFVVLPGSANSPP